MSGAGTTGSVRALPHGTAVAYSPAGRRLGERDRDDHELTRLRWRDDGALAQANVRIPDGSWLTIEPRATADAPWGLSDRIWHGTAPLTLFAAVDYARIGFIPPLAEPSRLPPGGGTAILNLLASLAEDQGIRRLSYRGPYPSEQLFLALLESFRYEGGPGDPLRDFMAGDLPWIPAPFERRLTRDGIWIQMRDGIEKVAWEGRLYYRERWQDVRRHGARRVRDCDGGARCSLWALGRNVEDHLDIHPGGDAIAILPVPPDDRRVIAFPPAVLPGLAAAVAARSAPRLAAAIAAVTASRTLEWGPVARDLSAVRAEGLRIASSLLPHVQAHFDGASSTDEAVSCALTVLSELAHLIGDAIRARAQAHLAALSPEAQVAALETASGAEAEAWARAMARAVDALLTWPVTRRRAGSASH